MDGYYYVCSHFLEDDVTQSIVTRRHHKTLTVLDDGHTGEPTTFIYVIMKRTVKRRKKKKSQIWTHTDYHQRIGMSVIDIAVERSSTKNLERRRRRVIRPEKRAMASLWLRVYILGYEIFFCRNQTVRSRKRQQFRKLQLKTTALSFLPSSA